MSAPLFLNFALRHKYEDRPGDKERNRSQAIQIKERSGRSPYFCRKVERAAPVLVGSILLYPDMERPSLYFLKFFCSVLFDTTSRTVGRLNEPAPGSAHRESNPSEDLFAHSPHRCSPSPGDRQLTLFVTGYSVFDVHKKILFFSYVYGRKLAS